MIRIYCESSQHGFVKGQRSLPVVERDPATGRPLPGALGRALLSSERPKFRRAYLADASRASDVHLAESPHDRWVLGGNSATAAWRRKREEIGVTGLAGISLVFQMLEEVGVKSHHQPTVLSYYRLVDGRVVDAEGDWDLGEGESYPDRFIKHEFTCRFCTNPVVNVQRKAAALYSILDRCEQLGLTEIDVQAIAKAQV